MDITVVQAIRVGPLIMVLLADNQSTMIKSLSCHLCCVGPNNNLEGYGSYLVDLSSTKAYQRSVYWMKALLVNSHMLEGLVVVDIYRASIVY